MSILDWIAVSIVGGSMLYLTFGLTLPEWLRKVRTGEGVSLLPAKEGQTRPVWVQIVILIIGAFLWIPFIYYLWKPVIGLSPDIEILFKVLGIMIYIAGISFMIWARITLGKQWGISTSLQARLYADHELIQRGPFAMVRHPMYLGAWVFMLGLLLAYPNWAIVILFVSMIASLSMRARREEAVLAERFGEKWKNYKKRTRYIIPFLI